MIADSVVIIQGPSDYVSEQKNVWSGFNIIWSTWEGSENKYTSNDNVIFNTYPVDAGVKNISLQMISTLNGIKKAKELGFKRCLKLRSDIIPKNAINFVNTFKKNHINFLAWHNGGNYFIDYFMEGSVNILENIWSLPVIHGDFPEKILTENIFSLGYTKESFNFILENIGNDNELYWAKYNVNLSSYNTNKVYSKTIT